MSRGIRIGGALVLGIGIVFGAVYLRSQANEQVGSLVAVDQLARAYVPQTDDNADGVTDWEEELRLMTLRTSEGSPELVTDSSVGAPDTLTGAFAESFFERYVRGSASGTVTPENQTAFLDQEIERLSREARDELFTSSDIIVTANSEMSLRTYGNIIATIITTNSHEGESELFILERAVLNENADELKKLDPIIAVYDALLAETLGTPVPTLLKEEHLLLVNAYQAIKKDIEGMQESFSDPLYTLLRIKRYQDDAQALYNALSSIYLTLYREGVRYSEEEPASMFKVENR